MKECKDMDAEKTKENNNIFFKNQAFVKKKNWSY